MIGVLKEIYNRIWRTEEWPTSWTKSLIITLPGNFQLCQNYRTISLISHSSKVMLRVILNRLKPQTRAFLKNRLGSELEGAPQNKPLTLESCVKSI